MYKTVIISFSIGRSLPHITDVSWRLEYQIKVKFNKCSLGQFRELKKKELKTEISVLCCFRPINLIRCTDLHIW